MDLGLSGRVAIVTGASRGIGKACAAELAAEGAHVVAVSSDVARNSAACEELALQAKGRVVGAAADLNDAVATHAVFSRALAEFGRIDILVNCAAVIGRGDFFSLGEVAWAKSLRDRGPASRSRRMPTALSNTPTPLTLSPIPREYISECETKP